MFYNSRRWLVPILNTLQVMTHEIGHMFGIKHCVYHNCAMNGSNHLAESDRRAASLCPICLRKLQVGFLGPTVYMQSATSFTLW